MRIPPKQNLIPPPVATVRLTMPAAKPKYPTIKIARISPMVRSIAFMQLEMSPEAAQALMRKSKWGQSTLGHVAGVDVLLAGDDSDQSKSPDPEHTWMMRGANNGPGEICHGFGMVIGFDPEAKKATDLPMTIDWLKDRIVWEPTGEEE